MEGVPADCNTQWMSQMDALSSFKTKYSVVVGYLEKIVDYDGDAERLLYSITKFDFLVTIVCAENLLSCVKSLYVYMQYSTVDLIYVLDEANVILYTLRRLREDDNPEFASLYAEVKCLADGVSV